MPDSYKITFTAFTFRGLKKIWVELVIFYDLSFQNIIKETVHNIFSNYKV